MSVAVSGSASEADVAEKLSASAPVQTVGSQLGMPDKQER